MKKIIASAVGLMMFGGVAVTGAMAAESQFGGYMRTRMYFQENFQDETRLGILDNDSTQDFTDTRTRLYYTAKFNDHFKFVNKFEFNTGWGDNNGGDLGADGKGNFRVKNSYVDYTMGMVNAKVGIQPATIARGFILSDDLSGALVTADFGMVKVPFLYSTLSNQDWQGNGWDGANAKNQQFSVNDTVITDLLPTAGNGSDNVHLLSIMPQFSINDNVVLTPHVTYINVTEQDTYSYYLGLDADMKFDAVSAWFTGFYNGGEVDGENFGATEDSDISAFLLAAGANTGIVHGQVFYSSGQDFTDDTNDIDAVVLPGGNGSGASYYWSEILGLGTFDTVVDGTMGDKITNIWAANIGVTLKPMDKLTATFDVWYAELAEDVFRPTAADPLNTEDELGLEFDAKITYALEDNLNVDFIFAYLLAGDAIGDDDIMEGGVQISLAF